MCRSHYRPATAMPSKKERPSPEERVTQLHKTVNKQKKRVTVLK